ncbi:hypothetical protein CIT292_11258 [Citrobacter youngae ATCC 29220]|uniref:Uncharacterized protein n=1 Tax=Citrobacter youngae ATCC 29220 TaxID=500640 RepID=D4BL17_9ENTR|nr:hypothetical protein CIT292_11258 [Citrobacter youngae ATCC 29220]
MHAVTMANVLGKKNGIIAPNRDDNAGSNLRIVTFAAVATEHRPFGFTRVHRMTAVTAEFMRAVELSQLYATPGQLKQTNILVNDLAHRAHIMPTLLLHQPDGIAFPLAYLKCALARKIEIYRLAIG